MNNPWLPEIEWRLSLYDGNESVWTAFVHEEPIAKIHRGDAWFIKEGYSDSYFNVIDESRSKELIEVIFRKSCYKAFLKSQEWKRLREYVLVLKPWCERCKDGIANEVHHKTYANGWLCKIDNLDALCSSCHDEIHAEI